MSLRSIHYRRRAQQQMRLKPVWVTHRRITRVDGPYPAANPPRITGALVVAGTHPAGPAAISMRANRLQGRIVKGDELTIAGTVYTASAAATDNGLNVITVPIDTVDLVQPFALSPAAQISRAQAQAEATADAAEATPFVNPLVDGAPVAAAWAADKRIPSRLLDYGTKLIDGDMIKRGDKKITIAAADLAFDPDEQDQIILADGTTLTVVGAVAARLDGDPVTWDLQVRR